MSLRRPLFFCAPATLLGLVSVSMAADATYVEDGTICIIASSRFEPLLTGLNRLFARDHPGTNFRLVLRPTSVVGLQALAVGKTAVAPLDRDAWPLETRPFRQLHGYEPTAIRIGRVGYAAGEHPPGFYVHRENPLTSLTLDQAARVFTVNNAAGDLTHWHQLGLQGNWAERAIHVYGPPDNGRTFTAMRLRHMGGHPLTRRYEALSQEDEAAAALRQDRYGIAYLESYRGGDLKFLPLTPAESGPSTKTESFSAIAHNPLYPPLQLYIDRAPGAQLDPLVSAYVRLALSPAGQGLVATRDLPLLPGEVSAELEKLQ